MKTLKIISLTVLFTLLLTSLITGVLPGTTAVADKLTGDEILNRLKEDETALTGSGTATINLITENKNGEQRQNKLKIYRKEESSMEKQLLEYLSPADVEGTKFLSIKNTEKDETQMWLYLPVLGRERRIVGQQREDKFMNTDFTYEDLGGSNNYSEEYKAERLEDQIFNNYDCYVLEMIPEAEDSDYSKLEMWVWQQEMMPLRIEFYNLGGQLSKKMIFSNLQEEEDYMPYKIIMSDELAETKTIIEILEYREQDIKDEYFTIRYLRR